MSNSDSKVELLYSALEDNQNTIRFTDTKAASVLVLAGILITFLCASGKYNFSFLKELQKISLTFHVILVIFVLIAVFSLAAAVYLSFLAISPKSNPKESIIKGENANFDNCPEVFYLWSVSPKPNWRNVFRDKNGYFKLNISTKDFLESINSLDLNAIIHILSYELQKVSIIREMKIQRVKFAISFLKIHLIFFFIIEIATIIHKFYFIA